MHMWTVPCATPPPLQIYYYSKLLCNDANFINCIWVEMSKERVNIYLLAYKLNKQLVNTLTYVWKDTLTYPNRALMLAAFCLEEI